jgi:hypothetical protein
LNKLDQALNDPQVLANDMVVSVEHTLGGEVKQTGNPIKISTTPPELRKKFLSPPTLGEHNNEVLSQLLGYPQEKIEKLKEEQQLCVRLFYFESKSYREISLLTELDDKKVKSLLQNLSSGKKTTSIL